MACPSSAAAPRVPAVERGRGGLKHQVGDVARGAVPVPAVERRRGGLKQADHEPEFAHRRVPAVERRRGGLKPLFGPWVAPASSGPRRREKAGWIETPATTTSRSRLWSPPSRDGGVD